MKSKNLNKSCLAIVILFNLFLSNYAFSQCASNGNNTNDEYIGRVQLQAIDNTSGVGTTSTGYSDFTAISTDLTQNSNYTITVTPIWTGPIYSEGYAVWIDYNQNNDFTDPDELVFSNGASTDSPVSGSFTVPATALTGNTTMRVSMKYNDIPTSCEVFSYGEVEDYTVNIVSATPYNEVSVTGNATNIDDGDTTPSTVDGTDFGNADIAGGTVNQTFSIINSGNINLNLTGASPYVTITGANAADFTLITNPTTPIAPGGNTSFTIQFDPSATGVRTASVSFANDDTDENPFNFNIQGTGIVPPPCGTTVLHTADFESGTNGWVKGNILSNDAYRTTNATWSYSGNSSLVVRDNSGTNSSFDSPIFNFTAYDKVDFKFFFAPNSMDSSYSGSNKTYSENFLIEYSNNGGLSWTTVKTFESGQVAQKTADFESTNSPIFYARTVSILATDYTFSATSRFRVRCDASDNDDQVFIDLVTISGTSFCTPTDGPGGVSADLDLWLRGDKIDGYGVTTDGTNVTTWVDNGKGNDATTTVSGQEPVYRNNETDNINFNPVIDFENNHNTASPDMTYINGRDELSGSSGFNSNDMFLVVVADPTVTGSMNPLDTFTSTDPLAESYAEDVTGVGFGGYTQRLSGERFTYCIGTSSGNGPYTGYGRGDTSGTNNYNKFNIINVRQNSANTDMEIYLNSNSVSTTLNDISLYAPINNRKYWLGRSQYYEGSFDGKIAEVITFNSRKLDGASERRRIESYLALKYGITLGVNGTAMDYIDSNGNIVWDASANSGFNHDIAGIFRDDASNHQQKQSKSINTSSVITIGHGDISTTNSNNTNNFDNDRDFLVWGHNNGALSGSTVLSVNLGASSTSVTTLFDRRWKIVENGNDVRDVKISIPSSVLPTKAADQEYALVVSNSSSFGSNDIVDVIPMNVNGSTFETWYDFENTKYFTFGIASRVEGKYNVEFSAGDFLVGENFVNLNNSFTVSAWVRNLGNGGDYVSKGNAYNFEIMSNGRVRANINGTNYAQSATSITDTNWHHIAYTYSGGNLRLYIDGVEDGNSPIGGVAIPVATTDYFAIGVNYIDKNTISNSFNGDIDEVRIWDRVLTQNQIKFLMNQELENLSGNVNGAYLPQTITLNEATGLPWNEMQAYHNINEFYGTTVVDGSGHKNWVRIKYLVTGKNIMDNQAAPLPYTTTSNGLWTNNSSWTNGTEQYIPGSASIVDPNITVDWNIVETSHNITMDNASLPTANNQNRSVLGLFVTANELELSGDTATNAGNGLTVTHYLKIDGKIDLEGESQLIQTTDSDLDPTSSGSLERDQQGTRDLYTYNYWASPVGMINSTTNNNSYTLPNVFRDGTNPAAPTNINFITNGYNGSSGSPIGIADYWIWKYANQSGAYADWQHVRSTGSLLPGEGFTMKGVANTSGNVTLEQNYTYQGKPNNGDITLPITVNNEYLVGNPYASAIDAHQFIMDNAPTIDAAGATTGTLYFWEHWGGGSHLLAEYQGGYATYNLSGATPAASYGTNDPMVATGGTPSKLPGRYIPVGQGFFVKSEATGTIRFTNAQRVFEKEGSSSSTFVRTANTNETTSAYNIDNRLKIRLGINTVNGIHRQLLVTKDSHATVGEDWGYDGVNNEDQVDDMYWMIEGNKYIIQGTDVIDVNTVLPIGIHTDDSGNNTFTIDALENVPDNLEIYIFDNATSTYHDIRANDFTINLPAGEYLDRFSMVFSTSSTLSIEDNVIAQDINTYYNNSQTSIIINNPKLHNITSVKLYNILSQEIFSETDIDTSDYTALKTGKLSTGTYIIKMKTDVVEISKKVLIE
ncbi:hypothetical protein FHS04_000130 [Mesoflavibacter sabulilitoris]|uniref:LamG-like jellyroll fold domain-containing protein n=1 Tax=Mesoflavibacter zeaxanthinifaciens TaxID=393060 RepID=UPI0016104EA9|nr:LamG-like jellyroll fold domain-containing protein [Mesoflavibacter zeaxanthinifaciens]MBB3122642.1 hypothetical protein [Mesoflavibacter zeaxanthinifaciens subsp. sabulilitoris]